MAAELTLNGQQYTADAVPFVVYPPPRVAALSPTSGPSDGNTSVTVLGGPFGLPEVTVTLGLRLGLGFRFGSGLGLRLRLGSRLGLG